MGLVYMIFFLLHGTFRLLVNLIMITILFSPPCIFDGMYAEFNFSSKFIGNQILLETVDSNNQSSSALISIRRSIPPCQRPHRLAVCVPAMFYISDTIQLIEFIENWDFAGATKFFFYWQAVTPAVKNIFHFYKVNSKNYSRCS